MSPAGSWQGPMDLVASGATRQSGRRGLRREHGPRMRFRLREPYPCPAEPASRGSRRVAPPRRGRGVLRSPPSGSYMVAFELMNRIGVSPMPREERGKPPRTVGSFRRRAGSAHGVAHGARIRLRILGRPSHMLRPRREARRHQRQFGASRCARSSCRCRCSRDRSVCSGPIPVRRLRPGPRLHSLCNYQHSRSTRRYTD
jgi:hypothetical protein